MINDRALAVAFGILTLASNVPTANALLSGKVCTTDENGKSHCKDRVSKGAKIAIGIICLLVLLLLLSIVGCIIRGRRRAAASEKEYNVEASQVQGPPTIIATEYNPRSGPSPVYSGGPKTVQFDIGHLSPSPQMSGPAFPSAAHQYNNSHAYYENQLPVPQMTQNHTAPVTQASFPNQPYPFGGYSSNRGAAPPKTAYMTHGFPRPLLTGDRLKDRLKERPASISSSLGADSR